MARFSSKKSPVSGTLRDHRPVSSALGTRDTARYLRSEIPFRVNRYSLAGVCDRFVNYFLPAKDRSGNPFCLKKMVTHSLVAFRHAAKLVYITVVQALVVKSGKKNNDRVNPFVCQFVYQWMMGSAIKAIVVLSLLLPFSMHAQDKKPVAKDSSTTILLSDSVSMESGKEVIEIETYAARFNPRKALLYAAVFPGMGQVYNKKYWKLPFVYGGFIGGGIAIKFYQDLYTTYRKDLFTILDKKALTPGSSPTIGPYTEAQIRTATTRARRQRDYLCILTGVWYVLQMVDAHVDAHLKEFDVNPQLKARLEPMMERDMLIGNNAGVALKLRF